MASDFVLMKFFGPSSLQFLADKGEGQVKFTLEQAAKAQRRSRGIDLLFLEPRR
jgi:hypothetical protein